MVQHFTSLDGVRLDNTWLTIGSFDGIHIGHQQLINRLNTAAHQNGANSVVLTFHPHPAVVLKRKSGAFYLTTQAEKVRLLDELDPDIVITYPFTYELSQSSARDYVLFLMDHLKFRQLWIGYDFALGKGREGDAAYLKQLGKELGYQVHLIKPVTNDGQVVSSSQIRNLLIEGDIVAANKLLGRSYSVTGEVVRGDGRGKHIGIPTANLETGDEKLIPGAGVYACRVAVLNKHWQAAVNVGTRPTFESSDTRSHVEAHILDFSQDLYHQEITIEFIARLRGEVRFQSVEDLIQQIYTDIDQTRRIISAENIVQD